MIANLSITDIEYNEEFTEDTPRYLYPVYTVEVNTYWIKIRSQITKDLIYSRVPTNDNWLDAGHKKITKSLRDLENAILAVIRAK